MPLVLNWQTFCRQTSSVQVRVNSCQIACTSIKYDSTSVHLFLCDQINCIFFIIHVYFQQFSKFIVILLFFRCQLINQGVFFWPSTCLRASPTKAPSALQERVSDPKNKKKGKTKDSIQQTALSILFGIVNTGISFRNTFSFKRTSLLIFRDNVKTSITCTYMIMPKNKIRVFLVQVFFSPVLFS